jgi:hypothetical protein
VNVTGIGIQPNDIILFYGVGAGSGSATITWPTGGATFARPPGITKTTGGTTSNTFDMAYAVATAFEAAASTLAFASNQNDFQTGHIRVYRGRNTSAPFSGVNQAAITTPASPPIAFSVPGITAAANDDIVLVFGINNTATSDTISITPPSGFGNAGGIHGAANFGQNAAYCDFVNNPGGAIGTLTGSLNNTSAGNMGYGAFLVSLAASGPGPALQVSGLSSMTLGPG